MTEIWQEAGRADYDIIMHEDVPMTCLERWCGHSESQKLYIISHNIRRPSLPRPWIETIMANPDMLAEYIANKPLSIEQRRIYRNHVDEEVRSAA